jgi:hypothetical protein
MIEKHTNSTATAPSAENEIRIECLRIADITVPAGRRALDTARSSSSLSQ